MNEWIKIVQIGSYDWSYELCEFGEATNSKHLRDVEDLVDQINFGSLKLVPVFCKGRWYLGVVK